MRVDIPTKFHEVWWKESKFFLIPPFFVSMATAAKFVQLILIFFYLSSSTRCGCCLYFTIILILILILILRHIFVLSISRRCLDQTLWNLIGIAYAMWSCAFKGCFFFNMAAVAMETAKMLKKWKTQKWS
jgi:hypothetical protein